MKKIGIVTIVDYNNYGNRLQNYALQTILKSMDFEVVTIRNNPSDKLENDQNKPLISKLKDKNVRELITKFLKVINSKKYKSAYDTKVKRLKEFSSKNIIESKYIISENSVPDNIENEFDYFIVGSDQVWNPVYRKGSPIDFLTFAPKEKRIAYAPSFGISAIPDDYKKNYKKFLFGFKSLSVREDAGAEIIRKLTGREAVVLVDPTLMLTKEEWLNVAKTAKSKPTKPFLLTYFLGEVPKEVKVLIRRLSKERNIEIVNLGSYSQIERYSTDPSEFIDYINSANIFLTDSFHGAVFSIILEKQFIVFDRLSKVPSMNSRIDTLLTKFSLTDRKWESVKHSQDFFGADFSHTGPIFKEARSKAYDYLKDALDIEDEK